MLDNPTGQLCHNESQLADRTAFTDSLYAGEQQRLMQFLRGCHFPPAKKACPPSESLAILIVIRSYDDCLASTSFTDPR